MITEGRLLYTSSARWATASRKLRGCQSCDDQRASVASSILCDRFTSPAAASVSRSNVCRAIRDAAGVPAPATMATRGSVRELGRRSARPPHSVRLLMNGPAFTLARHGSCSRFPGSANAVVHASARPCRSIVKTPGPETHSRRRLGAEVRGAFERGLDDRSRARDRPDLFA